MIKNNKIYKDTEYCMNFSNDEIFEFFISLFEDVSNICLRILTTDDEIYVEGVDKKIETVCFDGLKEDLCVYFLGFQTSIFVENEEIMFIDDNVKVNYTDSDTMDNVVYAGNLRELNHEEILNLIAEFVNYFIGVKEITIEEVCCDAYNQINNYQISDYKINALSKFGEKKRGVYENITIIID